LINIIIIIIIMAATLEAHPAFLFGAEYMNSPKLYRRMLKGIYVRSIDTIFLNIEMQFGA
jgi:hypothetical protein